MTSVGEKFKYEVAIIGGGPAGYTAALYCARAGLESVVIEKLGAGGQMCQTMHIENYPGFPDGIDGYTLGSHMRRGAEKFGVKTVSAEVKRVELEGKEKRIYTAEGEYEACAVIIATGATHRHLEVPGEDMFLGRGVSYCATCDGMFFRGKDVVVIGGGNTAVAEAMYLSGICKSVTVIHRRNELRATGLEREKLERTENVRIIYDSVPVEFVGNELLENVRIKNVKSGEESLLACAGVFISVGMIPQTKLFEGMLELDEGGYILAGESTETSIPGVFAAGDVRSKQVRQIVTATGDGAVSAYYVEKFLKNQ